MKDGKETWTRLGDYLAEMTELTAGSVKDVAGEWVEVWNAEEGRSTAESALDALKESVGLGIKATAKAWVATRQLMLDLSE
jgi:hypothetical protein